MVSLELVGFVASGLTTASFLPQVVKTVRTRHTADLSSTWLAMFGTGIALWIAYGIWLNALPIILGNVITFALVCVIAWFKFAVSDRPLQEPA